MRSLGVMTWLGSHELGLLLMALGVAAASWAFAEIADEVMEGETRAFDTRVLLLMRNPTNPADPVGPAWVEELGRDFSAVGGIGVLTLVTLAAVGFLLLQGRGRSALLVAVTVAGGLLLSMALKKLFDRERPDLVPHGSEVYTASFPSGHSMMSALTFLTLAALLARVQTKKRLKAYLLLMGLLLTGLVGVSRVYLGVHWPTDVLAGWTAGAAWAVLCLMVARRLQAMGSLDADAQGAAPCV